MAVCSLPGRVPYSTVFVPTCEAEHVLDQSHQPRDPRAGAGVGLPQAEALGPGAAAVGGACVDHDAWGRGDVWGTDQWQADITIRHNSKGK